MSLRHSHSAKSPPHTPQHQLRSSNTSFASTSSASSAFRAEEDAIIFELGTRWLRAGFEGESTPLCMVGFGPEDSRRVGDYRGWLKGSAGPDGSPSLPAQAESWTGAYELWGMMDLRDIDLGLVEDKIERAFRETYNKYLLTDAGTSRLVLVVPSLLPHPLLSSILSTLFSRWRFPSISLLNSAAMATIAAGLRSALVVDLGWAETTVSGIYEYREVAIKRSTRAMKPLLHEVGRMLTRVASGSGGETHASDEISVEFEFCEELASRFVWCKPLGHQSHEASEEPYEQPMASIMQKTVSIPSPSNPGSSYVELPYIRLAEPVERALFADGVADCDLDDEEKPIPLLVYNALCSLPPDARGICMSRIVFIGGGAKIPGIRRRILDEVARLVEKYGWSPVRGKVIEQQRQKLHALKLSPRPISTETTEENATELPSPAPEQTDEENEDEAEIDPIEQKLLRNKDKDSKPPVQGVLREVESLGPWAGASLLTSLKIRGLVEIEREKYLQHGLAGASRDLETHGHIPDRRSGLRAGGDRSSWTLAGWG
ncbi:hypothetical protein ARAM_002149 [Aspergillus rambellii]|uniref:Actin-related protein n=1 Tax=Aspergillus rambellii TaxID=308745 RepID=A0A0F8UUX7_9EURO|nr:hypothetical protein ARAM_002149 [Aspergillus rambellii]